MTDSELRKEILASASVHKVDLTALSNQFTVWCTVSPGGPMFCGGRNSLNDAMALGREHVDLKGLIILSADPKHGLTKLADTDRIARGPQHPGSGASRSTHISDTTD